jgi:hypothetical protein
MLASTVQFSSYGRLPIEARRVPQRGGAVRRRSVPSTRERRPPRDSVTSAAVGTRETSSRSLPQDPTACRGGTSHSVAFHSPKGCTHDGCAAHRQLVNVPPMSNHRGTFAHVVALDARSMPSTRMLLRKEVIQPHLPVRLPCYDFVPIASPTFDSSLPQGVGPPASGVTDFRDVTGGVYKARERIHRSNADLRLLATPTSWGRVADPNPN